MLYTKYLKLNARATAEEYVRPFHQVKTPAGHQLVSKWREGPYPRSEFAKGLDPIARADWDDAVVVAVAEKLRRKGFAVIDAVLFEAKRAFYRDGLDEFPSHIRAELALSGLISKNNIGAAIDGNTSGYGVELRGDQITVKFPLPMFETKGSQWQTYRQPFVLVSRPIPNWYLRATGNMHVRPRTPRQYN